MRNAPLKAFASPMKDKDKHYKFLEKQSKRTDIKPAGFGWKAALKHGNEKADMWKSARDAEFKKKQHTKSRADSAKANIGSGGSYPTFDLG